MAAAGIISRILGAFYRIPLANLIGDEGMGLLELAQPLYNFFLVASVAGLPLAISKLVAERTAIGDDRGAGRVLGVALNIMLVTGLVASAVMYFSADWLAGQVYHDLRVALAIRSIAPALFFVTVMSAFRGYFQGLQNMGPSALSQIMEQLVRVGTMLALALTLLSRGVEFAAAGAALGATAGGLAGLLYLLGAFLLRRRRHGDVRGRANSERPPEGTLEIAGRIFAISLPVAVGASVLPIIRAIDSAIVPARLAVAGFGGEQATAFFGQLNGMALPLAYFPSVLTAALATSIVPAISESMAVGGRAHVVSRATEATRLTAAISLPAGFGLAVLSAEICGLVYGKPDVGRVLASLAPAALFLCVLQTSGAVLQGMGHVLVPVKNLVIGSAIKVVLEYWLTGRPDLNIAGAAISTSVGFGVVALLNMADMARRIGHGRRLFFSFGKPLFASVIMVMTVRFGYSFMFNMFGRERLMTLVAIGVGVAVYGIVMLLTGGIVASDIEMVPRLGPPFARGLKRLGLVRS
jgi:stage V sporulation protein B